jgi:hypothetical protein
MDSSRKYPIDQWVEANLYAMFERCKQEQRYPTPEEALLLSPMVQLYQAMQLERIYDQLCFLHTTFYDGSATVESTIILLASTSNA